MDLQLKQVFVSTASFMLALLGFSLSVLTAIFGSFLPHKPPVRVVRNAPATSLGRRGPNPPVLPSKPRRSHVTTTHHEPRTQNKISMTEKSLTSTSSTSSSPQTLPEPSSSSPTPKCLFIVSSEEDHHIFRFSNLKPPWVEKKPKARRCLSSSSSQSADETDQIPPNPPEIHDGSAKPRVEKEQTKNLLLRTKSAPNICPVVEKKRSQPLRTQPYAAPYFLPPPVPTLRKMTRSRTLPPPEHRSPRLRSQSPTPQPRHRLRVDTLAPPVDRGLAGE
ncbi:hypothetical protein BD779DRAFT_1666846 [Infundibulicybe gibba]|nr:hypothetical protein BD779DRAFT_1666846 [Infundibulicybe gibba]